MNLKVTMEGEASDIIAALNKAFDTHVAAPAGALAELPAAAPAPSAADTFVQEIEAASAADTFAEVNQAVAEAVAAQPEVAVDADGVPWDERIHSGNKGLTAKGIWQKRRNLAAGYYEQITAELKGEPECVAEEPVAPAPPTAATPPPPAPAPEQAAAPTDFGALVNAITAAGITQGALAAACESMSIANVGALAATPDKIAEFWGLLQ